MYLNRSPKPALRPFVSSVWTTMSGPPTPRAGRELVLPSGSMHIAIRLEGPPLRLFDGPDDARGRIVGDCVIGGVRDHAYCKEAAQAGPMVGAMIRPGSVELLSRTPAGALAGRHTSLEDLWSRRDLDEVRNRERGLRQSGTAIEPMENRMEIHEVFAYLRAVDAEKAIAYYKSAFGAVEKFRLVADDGRIGHCELLFGDTTIMLSDGFPELGIHAQDPERESGFLIHLHVDDADAVIANACKEGARILRGPKDHEHGERSGTVRDPFGFDWMIGHSIEDVSTEEMQRRYSESSAAG